MAWVIFTIILGLAFWGGVAYAFLSSESPALGWGIAGVAAIIESVLTVALSVATISTGQVGLVYNFAGKLTGTIDKQGVVWKAPWSTIKKENVLVQREEFDLGAGNSAVSKDQQPIYAHLVLNYEVDPKHVFDLYQTVGPAWKAKLIDSRVLQDFKEVTATYETTAITASREKLRQETRDRLKAELGPYSVDVKDLFVQNISFSKAYADAIERKQVQVQQAAQAQAKVAQVRAEADQRAAQASGEARATLAEAEAQARANRLLANSITQNLIEMKRAEALSKANTIYVPSNWTAFGNLSK